MSGQPAPRTDAAKYDSQPGNPMFPNGKWVVPVEVSAQLESELAKEREQSEQWERIAIACTCPAHEAEKAILKGQLAEARKRITDLERCDEILHQDGERWRKIASDKHHEAEKAREQRDRLAEALRIIMEDQKTDPFIFELAQKALAAVEGGRSE
jgi:hypothetical protein